MMNQICNQCASLGANCNGTECQTWTGCVYRRHNLRAGDDVLVHLYSNGTEIITRNHGKHFIVYEIGGKLGIKWNTERSPYTCRGEEFTPFNTFASSVIFERISDGTRFRYDNIAGRTVLEA